MRSRGQISSAGCSRTGDSGQRRQTRPPSASVLVGVALCSRSWSYPVTLGGLDGLLAGRRACAHAVCLLAVCGVPVCLATRSRASLDLVRILADWTLSCLPGEGERARPAGWRAWHRVPESRSGLLAGTGWGRRENVFAKAGSGQGGGHKSHGSRPWFGSGCWRQGPNCGTGNSGYNAGGSGGLCLLLGGLARALALWATPWREKGRRDRTRGRTWTISEENLHFSHVCHFASENKFHRNVWMLIPDILLGPSGSAPGWWRRGWGRREGWGILEGRREPPWGPEGVELPWEPPTAGGALEPLVHPPGAPMLGAHEPPLAPTWFLWYSIGKVRAVIRFKRDTCKHISNNSFHRTCVSVCLSVYHWGSCVGSRVSGWSEGSRPHALLHVRSEAQRTLRCRWSTETWGWTYRDRSPHCPPDPNSWPAG